MTKNKIKILFCIHDFRGRGAEKVLATLLTKMDREKYQVGVFVFHDIFDMDIPKDVEMLSAHLKPYPPSAGLGEKITGNIRKVIALNRTLKRFSPDVALSVSGTNITLVIAAYLLERKPKIILSEHTMPSLFSKECRSWLIRLLTDKLLSWTYPRADLLIVPSKGVSDDLVLNYGIPPGRIAVIPNPLDIEQINQAASADPEFAFPDDGYYRIGFVGGLSREKNVACLLRAFALVREKREHVRLFLVGEGGEREKLESIAGQMGIADKVHFLGYRENPYAVLKRFDVLVVPSFYETFSYVMLEAMVCSVPVISTKWQGSEDLYKDRENCLLVPLDDPAAMALAIENLMTQDGLRLTLVAHGLELAHQCEAGKIVARYDGVIRGVLAGDGACHVTDAP